MVWPATAWLVTTVGDIEGFQLALFRQPAKVAIEVTEHVGANSPAIDLEPPIDPLS
jgi:hypothetical protein